jgi:hypothetical protein
MSIVPLPGEADWTLVAVYPNVRALSVTIIKRIIRKLSGCCRCSEAKAAMSY